MATGTVTMIQNHFTILFLVMSFISVRFLRNCKNRKKVVILQMMTVNTDIIILHTTKVGENSLVIHTLSREYGRRGFLVRSLGKRMPASFFLPLNILEANVNENSRSNLYPVRDLTPKYPLTGIRNNIFKNAITMFISEVLYRIIKDGTDEQGLFGWCEKEILILDGMESGFSNFHIRFLLELCIILGFSPEGDDIAPFAGGRMDIMDRFLKSSFEEAMLVPLSGQVRNEIAEDLLKYIEFHTESSVSIRSLQVLRELFR